MCDQPDTHRIHEPVVERGEVHATAQEALIEIGENARPRRTTGDMRSRQRCRLQHEIRGQTFEKNISNAFIQPRSSKAPESGSRRCSGSFASTVAASGRNRLSRAARLSSSPLAATSRLGRPLRRHDGERRNDRPATSPADRRQRGRCGSHSPRHHERPPERALRLGCVAASSSLSGWQRAERMLRDVVMRGLCVCRIGQGWRLCESCATSGATFPAHSHHRRARRRARR